MHITAVYAPPRDRLIFLENFAKIHIRQKIKITLFVLLLRDGHGFPYIRSILEPFFASDLGEIRINFAPFALLTFR